MCARLCNMNNARAFIQLCGEKWMFIHRLCRGCIGGYADNDALCSVVARQYRCESVARLWWVARCGYGRALGLVRCTDKGTRLRTSGGRWAPPSPQHPRGECIEIPLTIFFLTKWALLFTFAARMFREWLPLKAYIFGRREKEKERS